MELYYYATISQTSLSGRDKIMENGLFSTVSGLKRQAWGQTKGLPMGLTKKCKQQDVKQFLVIGDQVEYLGIMTLSFWRDAQCVKPFPSLSRSPLWKSCGRRSVITGSLAYSEAREGYLVFREMPQLAPATPMAHGVCSFWI